MAGGPTQTAFRRVAPISFCALPHRCTHAVNLFGDVTYEGGASINGPFLGSLGAGAAVISIVAGVGEFLGYSLRAVSGARLASRAPATRPW